MSETPYGLIYCVLFPNGKRYIGQTCRSLTKRVSQHNCNARNKSKYKFHLAINKYFHGSLDISQYEILDVAFSKEELSTLEIEYIKKFNSFGKNGYNMTEGGEGITGYEYTDEDRKKMSESNRNYHENNPEARQTASENTRKYYEDNPEARQRVSEHFKKYYEDNPEKIEEHSQRKRQKYEDNPTLRMKSTEHLAQYTEKRIEGIIKHWSDSDNKAEARKRAREKYKIDKFYAYDVVTGVKLDGEWTSVPACVDSITPITNLSIKKVLDGRLKSSGGFTFKYAKDVVETSTYGDAIVE
jgi:hypothetical protein